MENLKQGVHKNCPTKRAPDAGESARFTSIFLRWQFFLFGRRSAAHPSAGNANRWAGACSKSFAWFPKLACLSNWV
jgi:hypothetical protein